LAGERQKSTALGGKELMDAQLISQQQTMGRSFIRSIAICPLAIANRMF
jgi:hypothetical protein